jgi:hypothetical protein
LSRTVGSGLFNISKSENFQFWVSEAPPKKILRIKKPLVLIFIFFNPKEPMVLKEEYTVLQMVACFFCSQILKTVINFAILVL